MLISKSIDPLSARDDCAPVLISSLNMNAGENRYSDGPWPLHDFETSRICQDDLSRIFQHDEQKCLPDIQNPDVAYSALGDYLHAHTEGLTVSIFIYDTEIC